MTVLGTFFFAEDVREEGNGRYVAVGLYAGTVMFPSPKEARLAKSVVFISLYEVKPGEHSFNIKATNISKGKGLEIGGDSFSADEDDTNYILFSNIEGMFFPEEGDYAIVVSIDGEELGRTEFEIKFSGGNEV